MLLIIVLSIQLSALFSHPLSFVLLIYTSKSYNNLYPIIILSSISQYIPLYPSYWFRFVSCCFVYRRSGRLLAFFVSISIYRNKKVPTGLNQRARKTRKSTANRRGELDWN